MEIWVCIYDVDCIVNIVLMCETMELGMRSSWGHSTGTIFESDHYASCVFYGLRMERAGILMYRVCALVINLAWIGFDGIVAVVVFLPASRSSSPADCFRYRRVVIGA